MGSLSAEIKSGTRCDRESCPSSSPEFWIRTEYLLWNIKKNPLPLPLITSASYSDPLPGALGQSGSHTLLGKSDVGIGWMNGFQVCAGSSINPNLAIEGSYFLLPKASKSKSIRTSGQPGAPNVAVPVFDVTGVLGLSGVPGESVFILPGPLDGDPGFKGKFNLDVSSRLQGAEINGLYPLIKNRPVHLDVLGGLRWFQLRESLFFKAKSGSVPNFPFEAGFFNFLDQFSTANNFLGAQLGIDGRYLTRKWRLEGILKGALGATLEKIKIKGSSNTSGGNLFFMTQGTANKRLPGGIFAQPSNAGTHRKSPFAGAFEA
ncbi:MAG: BBP7 family outer membrane beta-barrel protein [Verrucomicrobia bacterium]|nr:BBP7 family outer membrane beta-barrel protein [Verrucomicrobiota bacterium]